MSWLWFVLVIVSCLAALFISSDLYLYGSYPYNRTKVRLMLVTTAISVLAGIPLVISAYRYLVSSGSGSGVAVWVSLVIALAVDAILAHDVGRACNKIRAARQRTPAPH